MTSTPGRYSWVAWVTVCVVWGTTYLAIKVALETIPPFLIGGLRYLVAGGVLLAWLAATRRPIPPRSTWPRLAGSLVAFAAYSYALRHLPVAVVSLHTYVNPVIAVLLGTLLLGEPFRPSMLAAGAVIVVGIAIVQMPLRSQRRRPRVGPAVESGSA